MNSASLLSRLVRRALIALYRWKGWRLEGGHPGVAKFIITGAPHTSNWDFVFFIGATHQLGIRPSFMGKHTLFKWPLTRFMQDMGGVSVDRSKRGSNYVEHIARAAGVPIVPAWVDNRTMRGGIRRPIWPSDDLAADLKKLAAFYRSVKPDCERFVRLEEAAERLGHNG